MIADRSAVWTIANDELAPAGRTGRSSPVPRCMGAVLKPAWRRLMDSRRLTEPLRLEATGQFLSMPLVGPHDNSQPVRLAVDRALAQLTRISGN
jgi:hypothetical protein